MMRTPILTFVLAIFSNMCMGQYVSTLSTDSSSVDDALLLDRAGNLYGSNFMGKRVFKLTPEGEESIFADGFSSPNGLAFDADSNLLVVSHNNHRVYRLDAGGEKHVQATLSKPSGLIKDPLSDTLYVTQYTQNKVMKLSPDGTLTPFLSGVPLNGPVGFAFDEANQLYVANFNDRKIFRISSENEIEYLATVPGERYLGFICYAGGALYGTSMSSHQIYKVTLDGEVTLFAGTDKGSLDGTLDEAQFDQPNGIASSLGGDSLYISDFGTKRIRLISNLKAVSIQESEPFSSVKTYVQDQRIFLSCELNEADTLHVEVLDLQGKVLFSKMFPEGVSIEQEVSTNNWSRGTYVVSMRTSNYAWSKKVYLP